MVLDAILWVLLGFGVLGLLGLIIRKIPILKVTDPTQVNGLKQQAVKRVLMEDRLKRKIISGLKLLKKSASPLVNKITGSWYKAGERLQGLEGSLRTKLKDRVSVKQTVADFLNQAQQALSENKLQQAEEAYLDVLRQDEHNLEAYRGLGEIYLESRDFEQAREVFTYLVKKGGGVEARLGLARVAVGQGRLEEAKQEYLKAANSSSEVQIYLELAKLLMEKGDLGEALQQLDKAKSLEPNNPKILDFYIEVSIVNGQPIEANEVLTKLREVNPDNQKIPEFAKAIAELSGKLKGKRQPNRK